MYMNLQPNKHKIISFNTATMTSLGFIMVGNLLKGGEDLPKIESLGKKFFARKGGLPLFYYFTIQSYLQCVRGK